MPDLKFTKLALVGALSLLALVGCGGKKSSSNNDVVTTTATTYAMPLECRSIPSRDFQGSRWDYHQRYGFTEYGWGDRDRRQDRRHNRRSQIGCGPSSFAACAPGVGIVCVPGRNFRNQEIAWYNYSLGQRSSNFCGYAGYGNVGQMGGPGMNTLGLVCRLDNPASCAGIGACQPVARDSVLGVCVR